MANDLWVWLDWQHPARPRTVEVGPVWDALKAYGDPRDPNPAHLSIFREALGMPRPVAGVDWIEPTEEFSRKLLAEFVAWVEDNRTDLVYAEWKRKGRKQKAGV